MKLRKIFQNCRSFIKNTLIVTFSGGIGAIEKPETPVVIVDVLLLQFLS